MILDAQTLLSNGQTVANTAVASTNVYDGSAERKLGKGEPMAVVIVVTSSAIVAAAETYDIALQTDAADTFGSPRTVYSRAYSNAEAAAELVAGKKVVFLLPPDKTGERCWRLYYTSTGAASSVTYKSFVVPASFIQNDEYFADAITIAA